MPVNDLVDTLPLGEGIQYALENLSWFPRDQQFKRYDDIETIMYFECPNKKGQVFHHIALSHEDLIALSDEDYITNVTKLTEYGYSKDRFNRIVKALKVKVKNINESRCTFEFEDGRTTLNVYPSKSSIDDEYQSWVRIKNDCFELTPLGRKAVEENEIDYPIRKGLASHTEPLIQLKYYDTAVRECFVLLENDLRERHSESLTDKNNFGHKLIQLHTKWLDENIDRYYFEKFVVYRSGLKAINAYIRNDFAHQRVSITQSKALNLIRLISRIMDMQDLLLSNFKSK